MLKPVLLFIIAILAVYACSNQQSNKHADDQDLVHFNLTKNGLFIDSSFIESNINKLELKDLQSIIGIPTREVIQSAERIKSVYEEYGSTPNNLYTYDQQGLIIYQKPEAEHINSILVVFAGNKDFPFSPNHSFSGKFEINGVPIDRNTTFQDLNSIQDLEIEQKSSNFRLASFYNIDLSFSFNDQKANSTLKEVSLLNSADMEKYSKVEWGAADKRMLKDILLKDENMILITEEIKIELEDLVDCYVDKMTSTFAPDEEMETERLGSMVVDCAEALENKAVK